jgi:hypothetical protein
MLNIVKIASKKSMFANMQLIRLASGSANYKNILTEVRGEKKNIGFIQLNRPKALNALNAELMTELSGKQF